MYVPRSRYRLARQNPESGINALHCADTLLRSARPELASKAQAKRPSLTDDKGLKRCAKDAGPDWESYAGHSSRSGLPTAATMADMSERSIMAQTGHKSLPVVRRYIRDGNLYRRNAAAAVGL